MKDDKENNPAEIVSDSFKSDVFFYSGPIDDRGFGLIAKEIAKAKNLDNALLILVTNGGLANSAYQIARLFQKMYERFIVFTPSICKSAGTIIALGAHQLIMDAFSELGPLDVQLLKPNEIDARKSGLLSKSAFESLSEIAYELYEEFMLKTTMKSGGLVNFKVASELSASITSNLLAPVYAQINPDIVGNDYRDLNVAMQYGLRLIENSKNASFSTVMHLVHHYPSHDFIIDNEEAADLFENVDEPTDELYSLIRTLGEEAYNEPNSPIVCALTKRSAHQATGGEDDDTVEQDPVSSAQSALDGDGRIDRQRDPEPPNEAGSGDATNAPSSRNKTPTHG
jgi:hypothetical protein